MKLKICIPFYQNFEGAKSGLREMKARSAYIEPNRFMYDGWLDITVGLVQGTYAKGHIKNAIIDSPIPQARCDLITDGFDRYLFIDDDIVWHFEDLLKLVSYDYDIVSAPYIGHTEENVYQCGMWEKPGIGLTRLSCYTAGLLPLNWMSLGFSCIKGKVFKDIKKPYFFHPMFNDGGEDYEVGEDVGFCTKVHGKFHIMCDFDIKLQHNKPPAVDLAY